MWDAAASPLHLYCTACASVPHLRELRHELVVVNGVRAVAVGVAKRLVDLRLRQLQVVLVAHLMQRALRQGQGPG